ncbi:hypothetical protein [Microbispora sp. NPDC049125]|uniref:hypothetical protein n=1 Tax=Microbispora sp. NPDC049125 TaxID=3154929 RepID=UPI003465670E
MTLSAPAAPAMAPFAAPSRAAGTIASTPLGRDGDRTSIRRPSSDGAGASAACS